MQTALHELAGRDAELERLTGFLTDAVWPAALVIEGEPGIGKTTLLQQGLSVAVEGGRTVLGCRPTAAAAALSFTALRELVGSPDDALAELPVPQRRALETALLLRDPEGAPPDARGIGLALLGLIRTLACERPLLLGIDDLQWLDAPSSSALTFALRRLEPGTPVALLAASRTEQLADLEPERLSLGPVSLTALQRILSDRLGVKLPHPALRRLHDVSAGNPFFALELARQRPPEAFRKGAALPVPETLSNLVADRITALPAETEPALQVAALTAEPSLELVTAVLGERPHLSPAIDRGVVEVSRGRIRFTHPLLAAALAERVAPGTRRSLHRRLADAVPDAEQRARHLFLAAAGPDPVAATALEAAARDATARGAPETAAELLERALELAAPAERARLLLAGADAHRRAGDWGRARELADEAVELAAPGPERARALLVLALASAEPVPICERALSKAGADRALRAEIGVRLATGYVLKDFRLALDRARDAVEDAEAAGEATQTARALSLRAWYEGARGEGDPIASLARSAALEEESGAQPTGLTADFVLATVNMWRDDHASARAGFERALAKFVETGDVYDQAHAVMHLAQVEWRAGNWARAAAHADEALTLWEHSGDEQGEGAILWVRAMVSAHLGELDVARAAVAKALAPTIDDQLYEARHAWLLGFAELSEGNAAECVRLIEPAARSFDLLGVVEPGMRLFTSDLIEAWVQTGRLEEAETEAARLLELADARPRAAAIGQRAVGLVHAARGDVSAATAVFEQALEAHERWASPFERGRTLLALGNAQRRDGKKRLARETLNDALAVFDRLGARLWAEHVRGELTHIGGRAPSSGELTPAERRVARLAAKGRSNKEVAAELHLSVGTVETHLKRIYAKLGVRGRGELAARL